jgi:hypothetical protein
MSAFIVVAPSHNKICIILKRQCHKINIFVKVLQKQISTRTEDFHNFGFVEKTKIYISACYFKGIY